MKRYILLWLVSLAVFAILWAGIVAATLVEEMGTGVTYLDLSAVFALGAVAGLSLGAAGVLWRNRAEQTA